MFKFFNINIDSFHFISLNLKFKETEKSQLSSNFKIANDIFKIFQNCYSSLRKIQKLVRDQYKFGADLSSFLKDVINDLEALSDILSFANCDPVLKGDLISVIKTFRFPYSSSLSQQKFHIIDAFELLDKNHIEKDPRSFELFEKLLSSLKNYSNKA